MILLKKTDCIFYYNLNPEYFKKYDEVSCETHTSYGWRRAEANSSIMTYNLSFYAKNRETGELFIELKCKRELIAKIETQHEAALQVINLISQFHEEMKLFVESNSLSYYSKLFFASFDITPFNIEKMESNIDLLFKKPLFEDMSDLERKQSEELANMQLAVRHNLVSKNRNLYSVGCF